MERRKEKGWDERVMEMAVLVAVWEVMRKSGP